MLGAGETELISLPRISGTHFVLDVKKVVSSGFRSRKNASQGPKRALIKTCQGQFLVTLESSSVRLELHLDVRKPRETRV